MGMHDRHAIFYSPGSYLSKYSANIDEALAEALNKCSKYAINKDEFDMFVSMLGLEDYATGSSVRRDEKATNSSKSSSISR